MKRALFFFLFFGSFCYSQKLPTVTKITPDEIAGSGQVGSMIIIDTDNDGIFDDYIIVVDEFGMFKQTFSPKIPSGSHVKIKTRIINNKSKDPKDSKKPLTLRIVEPTNLPSGINPTGASSVVSSLDAQNLALINTILIYKATISNTNFTIPIVRFNLNKNPSSNAEGNISLFTSVGAGVGISWGRMEVTRDHLGQITNEEYSNTVGFHLGALFSAGTGEDTKNVFAPTFNVSLLDFQVGVGYELGTVDENQRRTFFTISYAIPLYKLVRKSYRVWRVNPYPISSRKGSNLN